MTHEILARAGARDGIPEDNLRKIRPAREKSVASLALAHRLGLRIASGSYLLGPMHVHRPIEPPDSGHEAVVATRGEHRTGRLGRME